MTGTEDRHTEVPEQDQGSRGVKEAGAEQVRDREGEEEEEGTLSSSIRTGEASRGTLLRLLETGADRTEEIWI